YYNPGALFGCPIFGMLFIVRGYLFLDIIANLKPECNVYIFRSDATVDRYLYKKMTDEYEKINAFIDALWREQYGEAEG
ncbi:MAG: hypothetical protein LUH49_02010, partial [Cloacibacillus porcorum]|uniref:hypothetical protein n=1 Tax=Cloacibacillus porcorum TaxID=1197717 RepID=UPI0023F32841